MIPILYKETERQFQSMGLGGMGEATSCRVLWQANGPYELEMQYPVNGRRYQDLAARRIILASVGPDEQEQPFRVYRIRKTLRGLCTIYARHVAYDLMGYTVTPFAAESLAAAVEQVNRGAVTSEHGFEITTDKESSAHLAINVPRSVWSMLGGQQGSLLDVFGGEWEFDRFQATLRKRLGQDLGVTVRYGINLRTMEQDENISKTWTAVQPYWLSMDGNQTVTLPEGLIATGTFTYTRILVLDLSAEWDEAPTEEQLRDRTRRYISSNGIGKPVVSLDVSFLPLDQTEEYKSYVFLNKIHKGDSVTVVLPTAFDPDSGEVTATASTSARAVKTVWLPMEDRYESVRLGSVKANFISALAQVQRDVDGIQIPTNGADIIYPELEEDPNWSAGVTHLIDDDGALRFFVDGVEAQPDQKELVTYTNLILPGLDMMIDDEGNATLTPMEV